MTHEERELIIQRLLDQPDTLTSKEIDAIAHDEELRELYDTATLLRSAAMTEREYDLDSEWEKQQQFIKAPAPQTAAPQPPKGGKAPKSPKGDLLSTEVGTPPSGGRGAFSPFRGTGGWGHTHKWAAAIILLVSVCAVAATFTFRAIAERSNAADIAQADSTIAATAQRTKPADDQTPTTLAEAMTFENATLHDIAAQASAAFGEPIAIEDSATDSLRLYLTLPQGSTIADFVALIDAYDALCAHRTADGKVVITPK